MALFQSHPDRLTLFEQNLVNSWSGTLPEGAGKGDKFLEGVERELTALGIPNLDIKRQEVETIPTQSKTHGLRVCLFVHASDEPINNYSFYFTAQDFGKHLVLSRLLANTRQIARNTFEVEVREAYFSLVHAAMLNAVKQLTTELNQDFSKINAKKSEGIIDIA